MKATLRPASLHAESIGSFRPRLSAREQNGEHPVRFFSIDARPKEAAKRHPALDANTELCD